MPLSDYQRLMVPPVEQSMQAVLEWAGGEEYHQLQEMLAYHLGWAGEGAGEKARGKRIRPLLLLLSTAAAGGNWRQAVPAAAAVELLHNFSLIHDDIEDKDNLRRGRPTVWKKWGLPQAINAGDAMFALSQIAMLELHPPVSPQITLQASRLLHQTAVRLTQGQHLDMLFESRPQVEIEEYWQMVEGKTAALIAACTELGALIAGAPDPTRRAYHEFGRMLGLAFQAWDDYLGIWGNSALTGKSTTTDLMKRKKTLPVIYGLRQGKQFARLWESGEPRSPESVPMLASALEEDGARSYTEAVTADLTTQALSALDNAAPVGEAGDALRELTNLLLRRQS